MKADTAQRRFILVGFLLMFGVTLTKRLWLAALDSAAFWVSDVAIFVLLPASLIVACKLPVTHSALLATRYGVAKKIPTAKWVFAVLSLTIGIFFVEVAGKHIGYRLELDTYLDAAYWYKDVIANVQPWKALTTVYFALTAGIVEEYFYRVLWWEVVNRNRVRHAVYIVSSGLLFGLAHIGGGLVQVFYATFAGFLLAFSYAQHRTPSVVITAHTLVWLRFLFE